MYLQDNVKLSSQRSYTDEGFLTVPACISRTGIQEYTAKEMNLKDVDPKKIIRVYRPEEEVFSEKSLQSFANKPITNDHPPVLVDTNNAKKYTVGLSGMKVVKEGNFANTHITVTDGKAIKDIESGKCQLSNGYIADIEWVEGISPDGEPYDAIQRNIKGNHIAIVKLGRAGTACRVADNKPNLGDEVNMALITIDGVGFEVSEQAAQAVSKLQSRISDSEEKLAKEKTKVKAKEDEMEEMKKKSKKSEDELKAEVDNAKSKIPTADSLDNMVELRTGFIDGFKKVAPTLDWKGKDETTLMGEAVLMKTELTTLDGHKDGYIEARYDILLQECNDSGDSSTKTTTTTSMDSLFTDAHTTVNKDEDSRPLDVIAREKMIADSQNAWKSKGDK